MRWGILIFLGMLVGCASKPAQHVATAALAPTTAPLYDDAVAAALVYDPPMVVNSPRIDVSREGRAPTAYAGFEEITTTFYYLRIDDHQQSVGGLNNDRFERQAITQRTGVSYR
jgi:hypothetical protein